MGGIHLRPVIDANTSTKLLSHVMAGCGPPVVYEGPLVVCLGVGVGLGAEPPVYPASVSSTPGIWRRISSMPQKQPPARIAVSRAALVVGPPKSARYCPRPLRRCAEGRR